MPYPVAHVLFFVFCIGAVAVYATVGPLFRKELSAADVKNIMLLLFVGGLCSLFPDGIVVYNFLVNGTLEHCWIGPVPTHSLLFGSSAIFFGTFVGYAAYRDFGKGAYMGIFAGAAFFSHLLLDDIDEGGMLYLYPIYNKPISVFSYMSVGFIELDLFHYLIASFVSVFFVCAIFMMALFALNRLGFDFSYRSEK